jgi:hypothetical protein
MNCLHVEQAVFTSSNRGRIKGYQLVSKSAGIDRSLSQELCRWAPTRSSSENSEVWSLNCFPLANDFFAITRTTLGGPEYSGRGGTQVVTMILALRNEQLEPYDFNAVAFTRTALAMGYLKLPLDLECEQLPLATLPAFPLNRTPFDADLSNSRSDALIEKASDLIDAGHRVAIVGLIDPMLYVDHLIEKLSIDERRRFSFTTGLAPSVQRPFHAHFFPSIDAATQHALQSQNVVILTVQPSV